MSDSNQKTSPVRVRFALPHRLFARGRSPHALFNWLFARRQGGTMILRVEDTDAERNKPELVQEFWLLAMAGRQLDEGPFTSRRERNCILRRRKSV